MKQTLTRRAVFTTAALMLAGASPLVSAYLGTSVATAAETWPSKPVTIVVSFVPGGATDLGADSSNGLNADQFRQFVVDEGEKWRRTIEVTGVKINN